jgi:hypothetical protein
VSSLIGRRGLLCNVVDRHVKSGSMEPDGKSTRSHTSRFVAAYMNVWRLFVTAGVSDAEPGLRRPQTRRTAQGTNEQGSLSLTALAVLDAKVSAYAEDFAVGACDNQCCVHNDCLPSSIA